MNIYLIMTKSKRDQQTAIVQAKSKAEALKQAQKFDHRFRKIETWIPSVEIIIVKTDGVTALQPTVEAQDEKAVGLLFGDPEELPDYTLDKFFPQSISKNGLGKLLSKPKKGEAYLLGARFIEELKPKMGPANTYGRMKAAKL